MKPKMTWKIIIAASCLASVLASCSNDSSSNPYGSGPPPPVVPPNTVLMANMAFSPATLTIHKGTTITWKNNDGFVHTSTADGGLWNTGDIAGGGSKTTTFDSVGTFHYNCVYHRTMGMVGTITVQ